jgi:hypothetical protein
MHTYKILDNVILLEEGELIPMVLLLVLVLYHIMVLIRKDSRNTCLTVLAKVQLIIFMLLIIRLLDQLKEGPPLRLSRRPELVDLSTLVRLLSTDVVVDSRLL